MWSWILPPLLCLLNISVMSRPVECDLLSTVDSYLLFWHKKVTEAKKQLTKDFSLVCDWSADNKLITNKFWARQNKIRFI